VTEEDYRTTIGFASGEGGEVADVVLETEGTQGARTLVTASVVGDEIESIGAARESGEGAAAVQSAVDADDRGLGIFDATLGDREARYR
jgi:hypothetical protein